MKKQVVKKQVVKKKKTLSLKQNFSKVKKDINAQVVNEDSAICDVRLGQLEIIVDELMKPDPSENRIRAFMEAAGLKYTSDPVCRLSNVMSELDCMRSDLQRGLKGHI